jgi:Tfp pilus assembly protein PilN
MNAVNLIPGDRRKRQVGVSASPVTLGVIGALVVVLAAAVLYVFAVNDVRARKSELAQVTANAASWQAAANSYTQYVTAAQQQKQQLTDVEQLVTGRFPWSLLLSQIGSVLPANAALTSLQATAPSTDATAAAATTATATATASTTTQAVQISGCAASESAVAATMVALGRVHGVGSVSLASTSDGGASSSSSGSSDGGSSSSGGGSSASGGGCAFPVTFSLSLILASSTSSGSSSGTTTPATTPAAPGATPTASTTAAPSTGSAQ